jgi:integrase
MARGAKIKKIVGKRGVSYRTTVDVGTDPATGKRKQKVLTAKTKQELEVLVAQTLADVSRSVYFEPGKMTTGGYLDYWLKNYAKLNVEATTFEKYEAIINAHIKPAMGAIPVTKLTPAHVQAFITNQLENGNTRNGKGLSPTSVRINFRVLSESLSCAVEWEIIPRNVCNSVTSPRKTKTEVEALTAEQVDIIMTALAGTYLQKPSQIAIFTAMREGEILGLQRDDVNLEEGYLIVNHGLKQLKGSKIVLGTPKTPTSKRRIELEPECIAVIKARYREIAAEKLAMGPAYLDGGYVFAKPDGTPYKVKSWSDTWIKAVLNKTGIKATFHQLRHTAATLMLEAGVPLHEVSRMLGHSSVAITGDIYGHRTPSGRKEASRKLAEALAAGRK